MASTDFISNSGQSHQLSELRIVLIGGRELLGTSSSNRSATGNTILGKDVFDTNKRTTQSVMRQEEVHNRLLTVVDTPGWWWHYPRENTPVLDQLEIKRSVFLCPPAPHVFLLVIHIGATFLKIFQKSLEEHLQLFHERLLDHTIVLFSANFPCSPQTLQDFIEMWPAMKWLLQRCGNRSHVLDISNRRDGTQVQVLLEKIEAMVAETACCYDVDLAAGEILGKQIQATTERASRRLSEVTSERTRLRALIEGGKKTPAHLNLVMVGSEWSGKSSAGNTILGKDVFRVAHGRTTVHCEAKHGTKGGRHLTVVDSPGWFYNNSLEDTCALDKQEIEYSMYLCPPGPHAVLLVVGLASAFNAPYQRAFEEHMGLFREEVWDHTVVLFTRGDMLGMKTVEERIESEEGLRWLVEKCGNRYHVLDNTKRADEKQVVELLEKVEEMWVGNGGSQYAIDLGHAALIEAKKHVQERRAKKNRLKVHRQKRVLRELFRGEEHSLISLRVVLVGRGDSGKSIAGNTMLLGEYFQTRLMKKEFKHQRRTMLPEKHQKTVVGLDLTIVECPGWSTNTTMDEIALVRSVSMCVPGPHVFFLVVPISKPFTKKDGEALVQHLMPLKERVWKHSMVLFTWGDWLGDRSIEEHIESEGEALRWLVEKCGNRYQVLNYHGWNIELFQEIKDLMTRNKGHHFEEEKQRQYQKPVLSWLARKSTSTVTEEEEWTNREEQLIGRMLKALAAEAEEPPQPPVRKIASLDGAFIPSMSGGAPSEAESFSGIDGAACDKVKEWLTQRAGGSSDMTSGIGSISASASYVERFERMSLVDEEVPGKSKKMAARVSISRVECERRNSC